MCVGLTDGHHHDGCVTACGALDGLDHRSNLVGCGDEHRQQAQLLGSHEAFLRQLGRDLRCEGGCFCEGLELRGIRQHVTLGEGVAEDQHDNLVVGKEVAGGCSCRDLLLVLNPHFDVGQGVGAVEVEGAADGFPHSLQLGGVVEVGDRLSWTSDGQVEGACGSSAPQCDSASQQ